MADLLLCAAAMTEPPQSITALLTAPLSAFTAMPGFRRCCPIAPSRLLLYWQPASLRPTSLPECNRKHGYNFYECINKFIFVILGIPYISDVYTVNPERQNHVSRVRVYRIYVDY